MGGVVKSVKKLITGGGSPPPVVIQAPKAAPAIEEPKEMPVPDDKAVEAERRRSRVRQRNRSGRASTILTDDTLG